MNLIRIISKVVQGVSLNSYAMNKIKNVNPGTFKESRRNFDYLFIGEYCNIANIIPEGKTYLQFDAPDRTLFASKLIVEGKFSWLAEKKGTCVIICKKNNETSTEVSLFDIPFLHRIIIKSYKLSFLEKKLNYPWIYAPIKTFRFLNKRPTYKLQNVDCPDKQIIDFCRKRGINLQYYRID